MKTEQINHETYMIAKAGSNRLKYEPEEISPEDYFSEYTWRMMYLHLKYKYPIHKN